MSLNVFLWFFFHHQQQHCDWLLLHPVTPGCFLLAFLLDNCSVLHCCIFYMIGRTSREVLVFTTISFFLFTFFVWLGSAELLHMNQNWFGSNIGFITITTTKMITIIFEWVRFFFVLQHFVVLVGMRYLSCSLGFFLGGLELLTIMTHKLQASLYVVCLLFASCSYNVLINNLL